MIDFRARDLRRIPCWCSCALVLAACSGGASTASNDPPPLIPTASISSAAVIEGDAGNAVLSFSVTLSVATQQQVTVSYSTANTTATAGSDYDAAQGMLVFAANDTVGSIDVIVNGDILDENDELFTVTLSSPINANLGTAVAQGTINDDDDPPTVSITDSGTAEGDVGTTSLVFTVSLSSISGLPISVDYASADGSATLADGDYVQATGTLDIPPNTISNTLSVSINGDTIDEGDETLTVNLFNEVNVTPADITAVGTIRNDDNAAPVSGLPARAPNPTCIAPDRPIGNASIATQDAFPNLPGLVQPIALLRSPGDNSQYFIAQQNGAILRFGNDTAANSLSPFLDLTSIVDSSAAESGLLGLAFHPDYANNRFVYVSYTETGPSVSLPFTSVLASYESTDGGLTLNPTSEVRLLTMDQPFSNHNGGHITFGPDGYLYLGFGDGGSAGDPADRAQDTNNLFGALIRIDVDNGVPYGIPSDNVFAGNGLCDDGDGAAACPEIYAWGLRNPWRWHFDDATNQLWLGDVGQDNWEEIDVVELGGNYGWRCREGAHDFNTSGLCPAGLIDPVIEYDSNEGNSITGGFVYRGTAIAELSGRYVFADFVRGKIFASVADGQGGFGYEVLLDTNFNIASFAVEPNGELLFLNYAGDIRRIVQSGGASNNTIPDLLSDTGCFDAADTTLPNTGLIPYDINAPFWSDGAAKQRWYAIPDGATVDVSADGDWVFPIGTVLVKHFRLAGQLFETRMFMRHTDGVWAGYTYEWNSAGTDADRVVGGKTADVNGQQWVFPSESQCMECHTQAAGFSLGIEHSQLNRDFTYPSTNISANQLVTADFVDVLTAPLPDVPSNLPRLTEPQNVAAPLDARSRSYLHSNCSGCHRPAGPTPSSMDLRNDTAMSATNTCDVTPSSGDLGIANARIIFPGAAASSVLINRSNRRDVHGMPPLGSNVVDSNGVTLLADWVDSISVCP